MSEAVDFLAGVPLLAGLERAALEEVARATHQRPVKAERQLWRQGERPREMFFVVDGAVETRLGLPGERTTEVTTAGPGETVGELALFDGEVQPTGAVARVDSILLALGQLGFDDLLAGHDAGAFLLRRRLAALFAARLRGQLAEVATALGGELAGPEPEDAARTFAALEDSPAPDSRYVSQMASFLEFDPVALWGFLTAGRYVSCPPGRTLLVEGAPAPAYYLTINGAVEKVLVRGHRHIRVGLAGPGKAFGAESLIDGGPSPLTAVTRERSLLLVLPRDIFGRLFEGEDPIVSRVCLGVILRDLAGALRETLRPYARLLAGM
jgi:CRP-like cAMP-binding protein